MKFSEYLCNTNTPSFINEAPKGKLDGFKRQYMKIKQKVYGLDFHISGCGVDHDEVTVRVGHNTMGGIKFYAIGSFKTGKITKCKFFENVIDTTDGRDGVSYDVDALKKALRLESEVDLKMLDAISTVGELFELLMETYKADPELFDKCLTFINEN